MPKLRGPLFGAMPVAGMSESCGLPGRQSGSSAALLRRCEAVAPHHLGDRRGVGRAAGCGIYHSGHFAEVVRPEDARADNREHLRVNRVAIVEAVYCSSRYANRLARADIALASI